LTPYPFLQELSESLIAIRKKASYLHQKQEACPHQVDFGTPRVVARLQSFGQQSNSVQASWF
jgi:hypothetical protein